MKMKSKRVVDLSEFATPEEREAIEYDVGVLERLRQMPMADRRDMMIAETESSLGLLVSEIRSRVPNGEPTKKNGCGCEKKRKSLGKNGTSQKPHIHVCGCIPGWGEPLSPHNVRVGINRLREQGREDDADDLEMAFQRWLQGDTSSGGLIQVLLNEYVPGLRSEFSYDVDRYGIIVSIH